jgi:DNA-binding CsgD family transcriptional regulator
MVDKDMAEREPAEERKRLWVSILDKRLHVLLNKLAKERPASDVRTCAHGIIEWSKGKLVQPDYRDFYKRYHGKVVAVGGGPAVGVAPERFCGSALNDETWDALHAAFGKMVQLVVDESTSVYRHQKHAIELKDALCEYLSLRGFEVSGPAQPPRPTDNVNSSEGVKSTGGNPNGHQGRTTPRRRRRAHKPRPLTGRQREILECVAKHSGDKQAAAEELGITRWGVTKSCNIGMAKLGKLPGSHMKTKKQALPTDRRGNPSIEAPEAEE